MPEGVLDYAPPSLVNFNTVPSSSPTGPSVHMGGNAEIRETLEVGARIAVQSWIPHLGWLTGTLVGKEPVLDGDCSILLDGWKHPLGFYFNEFSVTRGG